VSWLRPTSSRGSSAPLGGYSRRGGGWGVCLLSWGSLGARLQGEGAGWWCHRWVWFGVVLAVCLLPCSPSSACCWGAFSSLLLSVRLITCLLVSACGLQTLLSLLIPMPALLLSAAPLTSYLPSILPNWDYNMPTCSYEDVEESYVLHYDVDYIAILPLN
jgi:hypothetical protein